MKSTSRSIVLAAAFVAGIAGRSWAVWPTSVSFVHQSGTSGDIFDILSRAVTGLALLYANFLLVALIVRMALKLRTTSATQLDKTGDKISAKGTIE